VISPVDENQWEDINWNGQRHCTYVNTVLENFCHMLYPGIVPVHGQQEVDPLGAEAVHRLVLLSGCCGEDVLVKFSR
jgi:hypothetical protein